MICSVRLACRPPYCLGQASPTHPDSASFRCQERRCSKTSGLGAIRSSIGSSIHKSCARLFWSHSRTLVRNASCSGVYSKSISTSHRPNARAAALFSQNHAAGIRLRANLLGTKTNRRRRSVQVEPARSIVPKDLALRVLRDRLLEHRLNSPGIRAVRVRIVCVPGKVPVADEINCGLQRWLISAKGDADIVLEVFSRPLGQVLVFGVAAEIPVL